MMIVIMSWNLNSDNPMFYFAAPGPGPRSESHLN